MPTPQPTAETEGKISAPRGEDVRSHSSRVPTSPDQLQTSRGH